MKKRGLFYFSNQITVKRDMTYESFINKNFKIDIKRYESQFKNNEIVTQCLQKILDSEGKTDVSTLMPNGDYVYDTKVSPNYKLAWNTLVDLKIIKEDK